MGFAASQQKLRSRRPQRNMPDRERIQEIIPPADQDLGGIMGQQSQVQPARLHQWSAVHIHRCWFLNHSPLREEIPPDASW